MHLCVRETPYKKNVHPHIKLEGKRSGWTELISHMRSSYHYSQWCVNTVLETFKGQCKLEYMCTEQIRKHLNHVCRRMLLKKQGELECDAVFIGPEGVGVFKQTTTLLHNVNTQIQTLSAPMGTQSNDIIKCKVKDVSQEDTRKNTKSLTEKQAPPPTQWNKINPII